MSSHICSMCVAAARYRPPPPPRASRGRHGPPTLAEAAAYMAGDGIERAVGLVMAPHYSRMSVELYFERLAEAIAATGRPIEIERIDSWKDDPGYLEVLTDRIGDALNRFEPAARRQ